MPVEKLLDLATAIQDASASHERLQRSLERAPAAGPSSDGMVQQGRRTADSLRRAFAMIEEVWRSQVEGPRPTGAR